MSRQKRILLYQGRNFRKFCIGNWKRFILQSETGKFSKTKDLQTVSWPTEKMHMLPLERVRVKLWYFFPLKLKSNRVSGKKRCSYNDKVDCDSGKEDVSNSKSKEDSRFPKYKVTKAVPEYFNKSLEEICGKSLVDEEEPPSPRLPRRRRGRIINGTRSVQGRWPWQVRSHLLWALWGCRVCCRCLSGCGTPSPGATSTSAGPAWSAGPGSSLPVTVSSRESDEPLSASQVSVSSDNLSSIQLVLGEHDIYNDREQFTERKIKLKRKIVHPDVCICFYLDLFLYSVSKSKCFASLSQYHWRMIWRSWSSALPWPSRRTSSRCVFTQRRQTH